MQQLVDEDDGRLAGVLPLFADELRANVDHDAARLGDGEGAPALAAAPVRSVVEVDRLQLRAAAPAGGVEPLLQRAALRVLEVGEDARAAGVGQALGRRAPRLRA